MFELKKTEGKARRVQMLEEPEVLHDQSKRWLDQNGTLAQKLHDAGHLLDGFALCSDYCFNVNPFFTTDQFDELVVPFDIDGEDLMCVYSEYYLFGENREKDIRVEYFPNHLWFFEENEEYNNQILLINIEQIEILNRNHIKKCSTLYISPDEKVITDVENIAASPSGKATDSDSVIP